MPCPSGGHFPSLSLQVLDLVVVPEPQVAEHVDHDDHRENPEKFVSLLFLYINGSQKVSLSYSQK